jgi:hypothetical protein
MGDDEGGRGDAAGLRACSRCRAAKPPSEYYRHKRHKGGRDAMCKACVAAREKAAKARARAAEEGPATAAPDGWRRCARCGATKGQDAFGRGQCYCRTCCRIASAEYRRTAAGRAAAAAYSARPEVLRRRREQAARRYDEARRAGTLPPRDARRRLSAHLSSAYHTLEVLLGERPAPPGGVTAARVRPLVTRIALLLIERERLGWGRAAPDDD